MNNAIHVLVEKVNKKGKLVYLEESQKDSNSIKLLKEEIEKETISNLMTNLILKKRISIILKKVQEIINRYPNIVLKEK